MDNKTALQQFIQWGDEMLKSNPPKILSFAEAIDKAQELLDIEKEHLVDAYDYGYSEGWFMDEHNVDKYLNERYNKENEYH